jgi:hypothetical protein
MSDLSVLWDLYASIEAYGTLIDRVIQQIGRGRVDPTEPDQRKLAQLLINTDNQGLESQSLDALMLDSLLRTNTGEPSVDLKRLGEQLQSGDVDHAYLRELEVLAQGLEQERVEVVRCLRGR